jgi:hypothetical protein
MNSIHARIGLLALLLAGAGLGSTRAAEGGARVSGELIALYDFEEASGTVIHDRAGVAPSLDLRIETPAGVRWQDGALVVESPASIASTVPAAKITDRVKRSAGITVEAWVKPGAEGQRGPARIVSLSSDTSQRNFTLGQNGARYDVRFRTAATTRNGNPSTASPDGSLKAALTHVVYTRDPSGAARLYLDGRRNASEKVAGALADWSADYRLLLANERTGDRPWLGELHLVAIYGRALAEEEVEQNFRAGARRTGAPAFETQIAPLLAKHCLECHGWKSKKGRLDLSRRDAAFAGGEGGKAIVPGKSAESLAWKAVESDEMPQNRPALSPREKALLREWIDAGAPWSGDAIERPAHGAGRPAGSAWLSRLTVPEYVETVRAAVGVDVAADARELLPPDLRADGFSNTAYNLNVDLPHVEAYAKLADLIVGRMDVAKFAARFTGRRELADDALRELISRMGRWVLRGPLEEREVAAFLRVAKAVSEAGGDFTEAAGYVLRAMLQSPRFLYRVERQRGDGSARPAGPYELASRLSYILWGGPPDEELLRAAEAGELSGREGVLAQARRMLRDPRAVERSVRFVEEWLDLGRLDHLRPDPKRFPKWDRRLATDMRVETVEFFKDVVWKRNRPLSELLNARFTYATPRLAAHYGLRPKGKGAPERYDLSSVPARGGLLTQGSVLTVGGDDASMVTRGLFVLHDLLRGHVGNPPPGLDTTPVPTQPGLSRRTIAEGRLANPACGGCHGKFEPFSFGLEKFDGVGAYHDVDEHGNKLRDDGEVRFPGEDRTVRYASSAELMNLLAASPRVRQTLTWKLAQFALGRPLAEADAPRLDEIHEAAQKDGGTYSAVMVAIVMSDLVRQVRTEAGR